MCKNGGPFAFYQKTGGHLLFAEKKEAICFLHKKRRPFAFYQITVGHLLFIKKSFVLLLKSKNGPFQYSFESGTLNVF